MARTVTIIGTSTGTNFNLTSDKVRGDSYYGYTDGLHTVAFYFSNFTGKIILEATLAEDPLESDWFAMSIDPPINFLQLTAHTDVIARTFQGNFLYIRVRIDRSYLSPANNDNMQHGQVMKVLLNH